MEKNKKTTIVFTFDTCEPKIFDQIQSIRMQTMVDIVFRRLCKERKDGIVPFTA